MAWLYEPKENDVYQLPIHSQDNIMATSSWQDIIDQFVSSTPKAEQDREHLFMFFISHLDMLQRDALESFNLVLDKMLEVINNDD